jgi:hypothetical protein
MSIPLEPGPHRIRVLWRLARLLILPQPLLLWGAPSLRSLQGRLRRCRRREPNPPSPQMKSSPTPHRRHPEGPRFHQRAEGSRAHFPRLRRASIPNVAPRGPVLAAFGRKPALSPVEGWGFRFTIFITGTSNKVQVVRTVSSVQSAGHDTPVIATTLLPALAKRPRTGTHSSGTASIKPERLGDPPRRKSRMTPLPTLAGGLSLCGVTRGVGV